MSGKQQPRFVFQPLTCIRQTGIQRQPDGTVTYTFVAQVSKEMPPVMITLMVTEVGEVHVQACFDAAVRASLEVSPSLLQEEMTGKQAHRTTNGTLPGEHEPNMRAGQQSRQKDDRVPLLARFEEATPASLDADRHTIGREGIMASSPPLHLQQKLSSIARQERPTSHTRRKIHAHFDGQDQENKEV